MRGATALPGHPLLDLGRLAGDPQEHRHRYSSPLLLGILTKTGPGAPGNMASPAGGALVDLFQAGAHPGEADHSRGRNKDAGPLRPRISGDVPRVLRALVGALLRSSRVPARPAYFARGTTSSDHQNHFRRLALGRRAPAGSTITRLAKVARRLLMIWRCRTLLNSLPPHHHQLC